jgi:hypothetical protein
MTMSSLGLVMFSRILSRRTYQATNSCGKANLHILSDFDHLLQEEK